MTAAAAPDRLFAHPPFLLFWLARVFTASGYQMQTVAVAWQVYELTGSALDLGLVGLIQFIPRLLLTPLAGNTADRHDRRRIMIAAQLVQASALLTLTIASAGGWISRELIYLLVMVTGGARTFEMPTTQALLPTLVPPSLLPRAVAMSAAAMEAAVIVSPALGGFLYILGPTPVYGLTTALFLLAASMATGIRVLVPGRNAASPAIMANFLEGIRFIRAHRAILGAISLDLFAVLLGGATALLPIVAAELLHTGSWGLGLLRSAPAVGALLMSLWLARHPLGAGVGRKMFAAVAVFGLATLVFALSRSLALSMAALAVLGAADMVSVVIRNAFVQLNTPDAMRGRVSAVNAVFIGASNQLGEFESGLTAAWFGTVPALLLGGLGTLLVVVLWMRWFPELRQAEHLHGGHE
ncbi:MAG: MFS transporter [Proteobacteria bacterium]|nr:MFS transporter [Pseudomonadota bacterium]HQR03240.1 MFS transporter [Rhodocyclaceae bacterium]